MHREQVERNWNQLENQIIAKWNRLTTEDLYQIDGMYDKFVARISKRYNCSREIAEREIQSWNPRITAHPSQEQRAGSSESYNNPETPNWNEQTPGQRNRQKKRKAG
jgi:uncharacterized protein YjbJ (UPF0337 family)